MYDQGFPCGSAMLETWVRSLGWEDPLEKGKATRLQYSGLENSMGYSPWGHKESDTTEQLSLSLSIGVKQYLTGILIGIP